VALRVGNRVARCVGPPALSAQSPQQTIAANGRQRCFSRSEGSQATSAQVKATAPLNIRKFVVRASRLEDLVELGSLTSQAAAFLDASVRAGLNIVVAGGTQAGRTASIRSCITIRTDSRNRLTPSPVRNGSSSSDRADWGRAIGELLFDLCLAVHTEDLADGPVT